MLVYSSRQPPPVHIGKKGQWNVIFHLYCFGLKPHWPMSLGFLGSCLMGIPLGWKTKMLILLMAWGRYRGQVMEEWGRTFGPGHTDACRKKDDSKDLKGTSHTVWRSQEDSLALRILQTVDSCPSYNTEYNMILSINKRKTVKAHIISQLVFREPFLTFFSKG